MEKVLEMLVSFWKKNFKKEENGKLSPAVIIAAAVGALIVAAGVAFLVIRLVNDANKKREEELYSEDDFAEGEDFFTEEEA